VGNLVGFAVVALVLVVLGAGVASHVRGTSGASSRAGRAAVEVEALFSPAKRHQAEQQAVVDTTRVDQGNGDGNPLDRYTDAAALRQRWTEDRD
jgi:hypothetical protein